MYERMLAHGRNDVTTRAGSLILNGLRNLTAAASLGDQRGISAPLRAGPLALVRRMAGQRPVVQCLIGVLAAVHVANNHHPRGGVHEYQAHSIPYSIYSG